MFAQGEEVEARWPAAATGFAPDWSLDGLSAEERAWHPARVLSAKPGPSSGGRGERPSAIYSLAYGDGGKAEGIGATHVRRAHTPAKKRGRSGRSDSVTAEAEEATPRQPKRKKRHRGADASTRSLTELKAEYLKKYCQANKSYAKRTVTAVTEIVDRVQKRVDKNFEDYWRGKSAEEKVIKYLVVAEAPPFPHGGDPENVRYLYRPYAYTGGRIGPAMLGALGAPEPLRSALFPDGCTPTSTAAEIAASSPESVAASQRYKMACTDWLCSKGVVMIVRSSASTVVGENV